MFIKCKCGATNELDRPKSFTCRKCSSITIIEEENKPEVVEIEVVDIVDDPDLSELLEEDPIEFDTDIIDKELEI